MSDLNWKQRLGLIAGLIIFFLFFATVFIDLTCGGLF